MPSARSPVSSLPGAATLRWLMLLAAPCSALQLSVCSGAGVAHRHVRTAPLRMISRVTIVSVGKAARDEPWVASAIELYTKRLRATLEVDCSFVKDDQALVTAVSKSASKSGVLILDERGPLCTSVEFAERLFNQLDEGGSRLSFFIGGADGLPAELKQDRSRLISLGRLTLTHQMARMLLVEQIYRATEIRKGTGYHKD